MSKKKVPVLVVDDDIHIRMLIGQYLNLLDFDFSVVEADNGLSAFTKLETSNPLFELVLLDWHMPNLSGIDFLKKIRADKRYNKVKVIFITAETRSVGVKTALAHHPDAYIVKPFQKETFIKKVTDVLNKEN